MEINDFFELNAKGASSTIQAHAIQLDNVPGDYNISDQNRLLRGNYLGINFPITFKQEYGQKLCDILGTGWSSLYLISDRLKLILEKNKLTGWKIFPIKLLNKKGEEILGYNGFSITGRCGPVDYRKGKIIHKRHFEGGPICKYYKGYYIGLDQWDGADFFLPNESKSIIITKKAADLLIKNKVTNLELQNLSEVEINEKVIISWEEIKAGHNSSDEK